MGAGAGRTAQRDVSGEGVEQLRRRVAPEQLPGGQGGRGAIRAQAKRAAERILAGDQTTRSAPAFEGEASTLGGADGHMAARLPLLLLLCALLPRGPAHAWYKQAASPGYRSVGRASGLLAGLRRSPFVRRAADEEPSPSRLAETRAPPFSLKTTVGVLPDMMRRWPKRSKVQLGARQRVTREGSVRASGRLSVCFAINGQPAPAGRAHPTPFRALRPSDRTQTAVSRVRVRRVEELKKQGGREGRGGLSKILQQKRLAGGTKADVISTKRTRAAFSSRPSAPRPCGAV